MDEADVAQFRKVDELGDGLANLRVHDAQPGAISAVTVILFSRIEFLNSYIDHLSSLPASQ